MTPRVFTRSEWLGKAKWLGTGLSMVKTEVTDLVVHYPGHDNLVAKQSDVPARLRDQQAHYLGKAKPYDLGYNWVLDPWGGIWTVRGWGFRNAANGSTKPANWNLSSISVQIQVSKTGKPTKAQLDSFVWLYNEATELFGRRLDIFGHSDGRKRGFTDATVTPCPGPHLVPLCVDAVLSAQKPQKPPVAPPAPPAPPAVPPSGGPVLLYRVAEGDGYWSIARAVFADGRATGARADAISAANDGRKLHEGDLIVIPGRIA